MTTPAWSSFSQLLRTYRRNKHWSQEQLAEYLDYSYEAISAWERGLRHPNRHQLPHLATLLDIDADVLARLCQAGRTPPKQKTLANVVPTALPETLLTLLPAEVRAYWQNRQHVDQARRDFFLHVLIMISTALTTLPHEPLSPYSLERLVNVLTHATHVDEATLADLESITMQYWDIFRRTPVKSDLLSGGLGFLGTITQLLHDALPPKTQQRLCVIGSDVTQIVGDIFFDMHLYSEAETYYQSSLRFAQQGNSDVLWIVGLRSMGFLSVYKGEPHKALPLLAEAQRIASLSDTILAKLPGLALREAETRALVGDLHICEQALGRAERLIGQCEDGQNEEVIRCGESRRDGDFVRSQQASFLGYKGVCYLRLGQPSVAQLALEESLTLLDMNSGMLRSWAVRFTDLGTACIQQGHLEQACHFAQQALEKVEQIRSARTLQRVLTLRQELESWKDEQVVKTLDEQITAVKKAVG
ncbi:MAG: helix-turn-helix transcriptional regulator [Ktedonobacteraceae bacterium]|nr:helix-turn-helix transcriptional regulator [Ktedonobacteraceae bacterium]